jgi:hypothetical protein
MAEANGMVASHFHATGVGFGHRLCENHPVDISFPVTDPQASSKQLQAVFIFLGFYSAR